MTFLPTPPHITHGGQHFEQNLIDASANINPLGAPDWLHHCITSHLKNIAHYPDAYCSQLLTALANYHAIPENTIAVGNGSSEILSWLPIVFEARPWLIPIPCYGEYRRAPAVLKRQVIEITPKENGIDWEQLETALHKYPQAVVPLGHPNNPTGSLLDTERVYTLARSFPKAHFIIDEAFAEFVEQYSSFIPVLQNENSIDNIFILKSATKIAAIPGLRLGWILGHPDTIFRIRQLLPPWSVNTLAQAVGIQLVSDTDDFFARSRNNCTFLRQQLVTQLKTLPHITLTEGAANWVLIHISHGGPPLSQILTHCYANGVALRPCEDFTGLSARSLRIAVRTAAENDHIISTLKQALLPDGQP